MNQIIAEKKSYEIIYQGAFPLLRVNLKPGERIKAESGAMVTMSANVAVEGKLEGGIFAAIGRMFSGEKFFFQTLKAQNGPGEVTLAPAMPGAISHIKMDGKSSWVLQKDGFFAGSDDLTITTKMQNLAKGLLSGEGFFVLKVSGTGSLFVSSFGAIHLLKLQQGEEFIVDNSHLVAWPESMTYKIEKASKGWISSFTSGEGLVCRFHGPGTVLVQTRNPTGFGEWLRPLIAPGRK